MVSKKTGKTFAYICKTLGLFEGALSLVEWIHFLVKYGIISSNSFFAEILFKNKTALKFWAVTIGLDVLRSMREKKRLLELLSKLEKRSHMILNNKSFSNKKTDHDKNMIMLRNQINQIKFKYRQACWDFYEFLLSFVAALLRVFEIKQKLAVLIEKAVQVIGIGRIAYDITTFGSQMASTANVSRRRQ
ncbi:hypothetical protein QEN19_002946 [Hanseniaspora menglaensis]